MKFIHAADIHIDSALSGLAAHDNAPLDLLRTATRSAFRNLIDRAIEEKVAFIILAGDIFDSDWKEFNTGIFFGREMSRCNEAGINVLLLRGNHDAANDMTKNLPLPPNVKTFSHDAPNTFVLDCDGERVALHGQSFKQAETKAKLVQHYPAPLPGHLNIGVLHTGLEGHNTEHASYAPCSLSDLQNLGYEYVALGHIHQHQILSESPWVVMPGNLQGRHAKEIGPRYAMLVTCEHGEVQRAEAFSVDVVRWAVAEVDISSAETVDDAVTLADPVFRKVMANAEDRPVACRVVFIGKSPAHGLLFGQERDLRAKLTAQAINVAGDNLWIEAVRVRSEPVQDAASIHAMADTIADLKEILDELVADPEFVLALSGDFGAMLSKVPSDLYGPRHEIPAVRAVKAGLIAPLLEEIAPSLLDRIMREH